MKSLITQPILSSPFEIIASGDSAKNQYCVTDGVIFKSFSFSTGTFLPIEGINEPKDLNDGFKFFIEIDVLPNLQPEKAVIKCEQVGKKDSWPTYPEMYEISPQDEIDKDGKVTKLVNGKTQKKCFVLIGYREDDKNKNSSSLNENVSKAASKYPIQLLNTDIILMASIVSGVPILFPMPFFNGFSHKNAIVQNSEKNTK